MGISEVFAFMVMQAESFEATRPIGRRRSTPAEPYDLILLLVWIGVCHWLMYLVWRWLVFPILGFAAKCFCLCCCCCCTRRRVVRRNQLGEHASAKIHTAAAA